MQELVWEQKISQIVMGRKDVGFSEIGRFDYMMFGKGLDVTNCAFKLYMLQFGRRYFLSDPCLFMYLLRKDTYREISYTILKHTQ